MRNLKHKILIAAGIIILAAYLLCLPKDLFKDTKYSTIVLDKDGELIGAKIADDGQWRFPPSETINDKYAKALVEFEDKTFYWNPGINPFAMCRALISNIKAKHITSGGSTISMQVIRMSRNKERTVWQKIIESILATRLELRYSKKKILSIYASHAPFGGNVVGIEAASWRYFGRPSSDLSWGEAVTLAVLPNSPSSIHVGKNREALKKKRNRLLKRLNAKGIIDATTCDLACEEPLPGVPIPLPQYAPHLTEWYWLNERGKIIHSSVSLPLQKQLNLITNGWNNEFINNNIADLAVVVIDVKTGDILAYCGNANYDKVRAGSKVDIARAHRSTGSILKPFLYCAALQDGDILPNTLLPDIPININGFSPQNFDHQFYGAVPASEALARSLNIPFVHLLKDYSVPKFYNLLRKSGMTTLNRKADEYGLSLILGGAEGSLLEITSIYAKLSSEYQSLNSSDFPLNDKCALWHTFEALKEVNRPDEIDWRMINSVKKVAWKTGTSYGFRDAWAVGVTPDYAVGVWVGNAQGQGSPGLTGAMTAGPVMFDIFNILPNKNNNGPYAANGWFLEPAPKDYVFAEVCKESGHLSNQYCENIDTLMLSPKSIRTKACPYHKMIDGNIEFLIPPAMEWYYMQYHPEYKQFKGVSASSQDILMEFIYPQAGSAIYLPKMLNGEKSEIVFNLAHRNKAATVYWHLDNEYVGETKYIHQLRLSPSVGKHNITVVDQQGNTISIPFSIRDNK